MVKDPARLTYLRAAIERGRHSGSAAPLDMTAIKAKARAKLDEAQSL